MAMDELNQKMNEEQNKFLSKPNPTQVQLTTPTNSNWWLTVGLDFVFTPSQQQEQEQEQQQEQEEEPSPKQLTSTLHRKLKFGMWA